MNETALTTYCGIYCGDCPRYQARFPDLAAALLEELAGIHFSEFAKIFGLKEYDAVISFLKRISGLKCATTCREGQDGSNGLCQAKQCAQAKAFDGCWECDDFETCSKLEFLKPFCGDAPIQNLRIIKQYGLGNWAPHRKKQYPWL